MKLFALHGVVQSDAAERDEGTLQCPKIHPFDHNKPEFLNVSQDLYLIDSALSLASQTSRPWQSYLPPGQTSYGTNLC